ncbi:predicted protein [Chaetoceros tenuissimus]|uniref:Uncharacterized protein n=1 Tax=Chaetoceros tenuissimus TaxID=426638 RepID=A0AAD3HEQ4_9STRA|nr:predicted protein [Chaetoceros tenuissimus]
MITVSGNETLTPLLRILSQKHEILASSIIIANLTQDFGPISRIGSVDACFPESTFASRDRAPASNSSNRRNFSAAPRRRFARPNRPRNRATLPPLPQLRPGEQRYLGKPKEELVALETNPICLPPLNHDAVYNGAKKILVKKARGHDTITSEIEIPKISNLFGDPFDGRTLEIHRVAKTTAAGLCATEEGRNLNQHMTYLDTWQEACAGSAQTSFNQNLMVVMNEFCKPGGMMDKALRDEETEEQTDHMFKVIFSFGRTIDGDALLRVNHNLKHLIESIKKAEPGVLTKEDKILPRLEWASEVLDNRVRDKMEEEKKSDSEEEDQPQMNPYNHEDLMMDAQGTINQERSHHEIKSIEDPSKSSEVNETGDTLVVHDEKLKSNEDTLLEEDMKEGEILASEKEMEEAKSPVERKQPRSTDMEEQATKKTKLVGTEGLLEEDAGGADHLEDKAGTQEDTYREDLPCTQGDTYGDDIPGGELLLQEEHDIEDGKEPVGSIFKIKPAAVVNTPVPWVTIKQEEDSTANSMIGVETNEQFEEPWPSSDVEMVDEDSKPAAKDMNMEEDFSLNSTNDGMHEPSEMSPRRNRVKKKSRTSKHKKRKSPKIGMPTVRRVTRSITANLKGNSEKLLSQIKEKEKDMSPKKIFCMQNLKDLKE